VIYLDLLGELGKFADDSAGKEELAETLGVDEEKIEEKLEKLEKEGKVRKRNDFTGPKFFEKVD